MVNYALLSPIGASYSPKLHNRSATWATFFRIRKEKEARARRRPSRPNERLTHRSRIPQGATPLAEQASSHCAMRTMDRFQGIDFQESPSGRSSDWPAVRDANVCAPLRCGLFRSRTERKGTDPFSSRQKYLVCIALTTNEKGIEAPSRPVSSPGSAALSALLGRPACGERTRGSGACS